MLKTPDIIMINCLGSYFCSIIDDMTNEKEKHLLLYCLSGYNLEYQALNLDNIRSKYKENPWGYQPVINVDKDGEPLKINKEFFRYLFEKFNIIVETFDMNEDKNLLSYLSNNNIDGVYSICNVDEFFISESQYYYNQKHNKHFLLIKQNHYVDKCVEIIDSEKNKTYMLSYEEIEKAVYDSIFKSKLYYRIDCSNFQCSIDKINSFNEYAGLNHSFLYISQLMTDMEEKLSYDKHKCEYYLRGYYYNILSKILPFVMLRSYLFEDNCTILSDSAKIAAKKWKNISSFIRYKIYRQEFEYGPIEKKLFHILEIEKEIFSSFGTYIRDNMKI